MTRMKWKLKRKWPFSHQAQCLRKCWRKSRAAGPSFQSGKTLNSELGHHVDMWRRAERDKLWRTISWKCFFFSMSPFLVVSMLLLIRWKKKIAHLPLYRALRMVLGFRPRLAHPVVWQMSIISSHICYSCIRSQCSSSSLSFANFYDRERKNVKPLNTFSPTAPIGPTPPGGPCGPCNMSNSKCKFYRYQYLAPV